MQIQKIDNSSFGSVIVQKSGKKALVQFIDGVANTKTAKTRAEELLIDLREQLSECDARLNREQAKNLDIVLFEDQSEDTFWTKMPTVVIKDDNKALSEYLDLQELKPLDKTIGADLIDQNMKKTEGLKISATEIDTRANLITAKVNNWFDKSLKTILATKNKMKKNEVKTETSEQIVSSVFGLNIKA